MTVFVSVGEMHMTDFVSLEEQDGGRAFFCPKVTVASIFCLVRSTERGRRKQQRCSSTLGYVG